MLVLTKSAPGRFTLSLRAPVDTGANCGSGKPSSPGFQPGNQCAKGKITKKGEVLVPATRHEETKKWMLDADGKEAPEHIQKLGIPPAWREVFVNKDPNGDLLAQGVDAKGRVQSKYGATHDMKSSADKFGRVSELRKMRKQIFKEIEEDIKAKGMIADTALCLKLIMMTGMRPGSDTDTKAEHKSYGATTLEGRHIVTKPDGSVVVKFVPGKKKGQEIEMPIHDKKLAAQLVKKAKKAGPNGRIFDTDAGRVRSYSKKKDGGGFKTKDHRTALGTELAITEIRSRPLPTTKKEYKKQVKEVCTAVASVLGNTAGMCLKSYIDPHVWTKWKRKAKA